MRVVCGVTNLVAPLLCFDKRSQSAGRRSSLSSWEGRPLRGDYLVGHPARDRDTHLLLFTGESKLPPLLIFLGYVRRSGDAVSQLNWAGDGAERLEAFAGAKDRHVAIVKQSPED